MKLRIIIILLAALVNNGFAQTSKDICSSKTIFWNAAPSHLPAGGQDIGSVSDAKNIIADIISVIGLKPNFEVQEAKVDNACAVIYETKRYILYNPEFISNLNKKAGNNWASISILAHEIGHHLNGHTLEGSGSSPEIELEADEFSGFVLRRMGASLQDAQTAMRIAADYKSSLTHPGQADRLTAIARGWNTADKQQGGKDLAKTNRPKTAERKVKNDDEVASNLQVRKKEPVQTPAETRRTNPSNGNSRSAQLEDAASLTDNTYRRTSTTPTQSDRSGITDRSIIADVSFAADNSSSYYITSKFSLVKEVDNRLAKIGRLESTDSNEFPFIITDDEGTKLWVDSKGNIINKDNKTVGLVKVRG